jgi:hypothetical protein
MDLPLTQIMQVLRNGLGAVVEQAVDLLDL